MLNQAAPRTANQTDAATARSILKNTFGYDEFRGFQSDVIEHVSEGGDALVLMPTGGGKSLTYQIPAMLRTGVGVVVSPLIALMQDQVMALTEAGVRAAFLNSSMSSSEAAAVERQMRAGQLDLVYIAPGALDERALPAVAWRRRAGCGPRIVCDR